MHFGFAGEGFPLLSLPKTPSGIWFVRRGRIGASSGVMFAILVCTENLICVDGVIESPMLTQCSGC